MKNMSVNEELYSAETMARLDAAHEPRVGNEAANCRGPAAPDPLLGAEARLARICEDAVEPATSTLTKLANAYETKVPASYVHRLAERLVQAERDIKHLIRSAFGQDKSEHQSLAQRIGQLERDVKAVAEMAHQACSVSSRNYRDLTDLQEGKALRDSSGLLTHTVERTSKCEQDIHDLYAWQALMTDRIGALGHAAEPTGLPPAVRVPPARRAGKSAALQMAPDRPPVRWIDGST